MKGKLAWVRQGSMTNPVVAILPAKVLKTIQIDAKSMEGHNRGEALSNKETGAPMRFRHQILSTVPAGLLLACRREAALKVLP
jgi:Zn-dependent membrane protease YugP